MAVASLDLILNAQAYQRQLTQTLGMTEKQAAAQGLKMAREDKKRAEEAAKAHQAAAKKAEDAQKKAAENSGAAWVSSFRTAALAVGAIVGAALAVDRLIHSVIDLRNEMGDMSTRTGVAAETLRTLKFASEASGQEFAGLVRVMQQIPKRLADADAGSKKVVTAFANLGIETKTTDGKFREADAVFKDIIRSLEGIESKTEKAARATDLLGRKGGDLIVAVGGGAEQFERMVHFTDRWGADVGPQAIQTAAEMQIGYASLDLVLEGVKDKIGGMIIESDSLKATASVVVFWATLVEASFDSVGDSIRGLAFSWQKLKEGDLDGVIRGLEEVESPTGSIADGFWEASKAIVEFGEEWDGIMGGASGPLRGGGDGSDTPGGKIAKGFEQAQQIGRAAISDLLSERAKLNLAYEDTKNKLLDIIDEHGDESEAGKAAAAALIAANNQRLRQIDELAEKEREAKEESERKQAEADEKASQERRKRLEEDADREIALARAVSDSKVSLAIATADSIGSIAQTLAGDNEAAQRRAWAVDKASGIAGAALNTAVAVSNAFADVPYPANIFAAIQAGIQGAAHFAAVAAAPAPSFYGGGEMSLPYASTRGERISFDAHPREKVKIERQGEGDSRPVAPIVRTYIGGREVATTVEEQTRRGGPLQASLDRRYGRIGRSIRSL